MRCLFPASLVALVLIAGAGFAQEASSPMPQKNPRVTPTSRLAAAKTVYMKDGGGSSIPFNVISNSMEGWGRFEMVNSPEKADLILEVTTSSTGEGGVSVSSTTDSGYGTPGAGSKSTTSKELSTGPIRLAAIDGKSKSVLWSAIEDPKYAMRKKQQEDNLVRAAEKLFSKFHDRVEPPPAQ